MKSLSTWVSPTDFVTILSHYPCVFVSRFTDFVTPLMCFLFLFFIVVSLVKHCLKCYMNKTWNGYDFFWCPLYILLLPTSPRNIFIKKKKGQSTVWAFQPGINMTWFYKDVVLIVWTQFFKCYPLLQFLRRLFV